MNKLNEEISVEEQAQRLLNVSIKTPQHLKAWLEESNRRWLVFDAVELVEALPWPGGVDTLIQIIGCYRDHRSTQPSGRVHIEIEPIKGREVEVPVMKTDTLEVEELDRAIRYLVGLITEKDSKWTLENQPL